MARPDLPIDDVGRTLRTVAEDMYLEAMVLADEARSYFDGYGRAERAVLPVALQAVFSVEALKVTTRLMHVISWAMPYRASAGANPPQEIGRAPETEDEVLERLPEDAARIIVESRDLYGRASRVSGMILRGPGTNTPLDLQEMLSTAFGP